MTKQRHCYFTDIVIAIDKLADALDPDREKPFRGDILDLLEWAEKDVLEMRQQLAATADLDGIILCEKEPVAEVKKHTGSLKDMSIIVWYGEQPAEGTQLYRAKEQGT